MPTNNYRIITLFILTVTTVIGCASIKFHPQKLSNNYSNKNIIVPKSSKLPKFKTYDCGLEILHFVINFKQESNVTEDEIRQKLINKKSNELISIEMPILLRKYNIKTKLLKFSKKSIVKSVENNKPIIALINMNSYIKAKQNQNIPFTLNHYFLICGYDAEKKCFIGLWYDGFIFLDETPFMNALNEGGRFILSIK